MDYDFTERLRWSEGQRAATDEETIRNLLIGCVNVRVATDYEQVHGIDYIATLQGGAPVFVDTKAREPGAKRYWRHGTPELALETWSIKPSEHTPNGKIGWTLNQKSRTNMVLYTFDPADTTLCYFVGFQSLRIAFERFQHEWAFRYGTKEQSSNGGDWRSEAIFVPATVVLNAIREVSRDIASHQEALFQ